MEDLQEEIQKLVHDGGRIDEDQANMVKVAACFLATKVSCRTLLKRDVKLQLTNSCRTGEADGYSHSVSLFLFPLVACPLLDKKLETMEMSQLTAFEYAALL